MASVFMGVVETPRHVMQGTLGQQDRVQVAETAV